MRHRSSAYYIDIHRFTPSFFYHDELFFSALIVRNHFTDGYHSCHGVASTAVIKTDFKNDEYVVYNASQVRLDYLVEFALSV